MKIKIKIGDLFKALDIVHDSTEEKEHKTKVKIKIKTDKNEFAPIYSYITKTLDSYITTYDNGNHTITSNEHLILTESGCKKIKDVSDENIVVVDDYGYRTYTKKIETNLFKEMDTLYDFAIPNPHLYKTTNGFIHHNSLIQYATIRYLLASNENILLVVPTISLVEQMFSDFESYGWTDAKEHCNLIYAGKSFDPNKKVTISTWQSIYNKSPMFFKNFSGLIVDETHGVTGNSLQTICKQCVNAHYRVGLTGTMPKDAASIATIVGYLGPVLYELGAKELIDQGVISQIEIRNVIAKYPENMCHARMDYATEQKDIFEYSNRTKKIISKLAHIIKGQNTLLLVQRIEHLKEIRDYLVDNHQDIKVYTISGETKPEERERIRKIIDFEDNVILVATYQTLSTGVSIKKLHNIIFFASYKSEVKVLQSIGRGLRMHDSKDKMILWDVVDDMRYKNNGKIIKNYSYNHWEKYRLTYYEEQCFEYTNETINI